MSKINADELVDLFKEEVTKKERKELKRQRKKEKQLEKKENFEFKRLTEIKENKVSKQDETSISNFLYDTFFGFCLILLFFITCGFIYFNITKNKGDLYLIQTIILTVFVISYINSQLFKNTNIKKFFTIIASISLSIYMIYTLYYFI